jgi:HEAT repeat protein
MRLKAYVLFPFWCLGLVSWASNDTMEQARLLIVEVRQKTRSPSSAGNRLETLKIQKASSVMLLEMLQKPMDMQTRYRLAELLALLSQPVSAHYFLNALEGEDAYLRMMAATALGQLRVQAALPKLVKMLEDERLALRREAAVALGRLRLKQAGKPLVAALHAEAEPEAREQMLWALGMLNDKENLSSIQGFLTHSSESARWASARALLAMGEISGWKWLRPHLSSKEDSECAYALLSLEEAVPGKSWRAEALVVLNQLMKEREASLAASAAILAARWGDKSAGRWLEKKVEQSQGLELQVFQEALAKVRSLAGLPEPGEKRF